MILDLLKELIFVTLGFRQLWSKFVWKSRKMLSRGQFRLELIIK